MKAHYDLAVGTILAGVLLVASVALGLRALGDLVTAFTGHEEQAFLWAATAQDLGTSAEAVRLAVFGVLHALILAAVSPWLHRAWTIARDRLLAPPRKRRAPRSGPRRAAELGATALITLSLVPLVIQPTLVPFSADREAWIERAANLVDGQASAAAASALVAAWRWIGASAPRSTWSITEVELEESLRAGGGPLMDRWDPLLREATDDPVHFAQTKAFMWVESAGRQYAVSATGCAGLMQFCVGTARRAPFGRIFGVGQVSPCGCRGCAIPVRIQHELEVDPTALDRHRSRFPCAAADARFDPSKSIRAGAAYVRELSSAFGGNLAVMYVGYNSGPAVARRVYRGVGERSSASLEDIGPHLAPALRRYYGPTADARSRGLLDTHLPKLLRAYERYLRG